MSTLNIGTAAREYASRPADERFASLQALVDSATYDKTHSAERSYNLRDLEVVTDPDNGLMLASPKGKAKFSHYSFGQLARTVGAPAGYLRDLPPGIAADALNFGMREATPVGTDVNLLVRANGGAPIVRACTSDTYGRVWDATLYGELQRHFGDGVENWQSAPTWSGETIGGYRGDRDSFVLRINGGSIVNDPSMRGNDGQMFRGIMVRNSEVGHASILIEVVLYRFICGNHMLWGATMDRTFRRRHVGTKVTRDTMRELQTLAYNYSNRSAATDERIIEGLISHEIAQTREAVIDELRKMGATKDAASQAYDACEKHENASPRSFWGISQGLTRVSQESGWQDDRLLLDQLAAAVMRRGALVAA